VLEELLEEREEQEERVEQLEGREEVVELGCRLAVGVGCSWIGCNCWSGCWVVGCRVVVGQGAPGSGFGARLGVLRMCGDDLDDGCWVIVVVVVVVVVVEQVVVTGWWWEVVTKQGRSGHVE